MAVARQPILDSKGSLLGYELLFRGHNGESAGVLDHSAATSTVILDGLFDVGLSDLVGDNVAYVNVTRDFLLSVRPPPLPAERVVLELLEDQVVDDALLGVLGELTANGFTIALDDFRLTPATERLLRYASVVKVDVLEHGDRGLEDLVTHLRSNYAGLTLLAEKVETPAEWVRCRVLGFDAFQGYFFARPARLQRSRLPTQGLTSLSTMVELSATEDFDELNRIIARDAGLSMRLLRYANSASVSLPRRVGSVQEGLAWLGAATVRRFAMIVALAGVHDVPHELLTTALVRARMCQLLSGAGDSAAGDSYFTVGLFSVADALADAPMQLVVEQLPFRYDIVDALLYGNGKLGGVLAGVTAYQRGDFDAAGELIAGHPDVEQAYREAIAWADRSIAELA
ncbi:MAG TPA: HDOD domain-containing protein [Solirubrobacteraceae bacterium]|nr:HDOD domain-containing protein [Solirubrobacteraceae bacterium]